MATLAQLQADVQRTTDLEQSAITLINGLAEQIRNLPLTQQALDDMAASLESRAAALADAITANTPGGAPTPPGGSPVTGQTAAQTQAAKDQASKTAALKNTGRPPGAQQPGM